MKITRTVFALTLAAFAVLSGCASAKSFPHRREKSAAALRRAAFFSSRAFPMPKPASVLFPQSLWQNGREFAM